MSKETMQTVDILVQKSETQEKSIVQVEGYPVSLPHDIQGVVHRMHLNESRWAVTEVTTGMALHNYAKSKSEAIKQATKRLNEVKNIDMVKDQIKHNQIKRAELSTGQAVETAAPPPPAPNQTDVDERINIGYLGSGSKDGFGGDQSATMHLNRIVWKDSPFKPNVGNEERRLVSWGAYFGETEILGYAWRTANGDTGAVVGDILTPLPQKSIPVASAPPAPPAPTGTEVEAQDKHDEQAAVKLLPSLNDYDVVIVAESGGKDSVACALKLIEYGVDPAKIELWHQCIDDGEAFMDWTCTESYVQAFGDLLGINVFFQWREGGFKGELFRKDGIKGGVYYYSPGGGIEYLPSKEQPPTSRLMWPQLGFDLSKRWCSGELKIDVGKRVIANDPRYQGTVDNPIKILYVSGERREESAFRAKYEQIQLHTTNCKSRLVHHWRLVIDFSERDIWDLYEKRSLRPHPAYSLGWSRTSCFGCIFSTADLWAMMREIAPERFNKLVEAERELNHTVNTKKVKGQTVGISIVDLANKGSLDRLPKGDRLSRLVYEALNEGFRFKASDLIMDKWELPAGAFKGNEGGSL